MLDGEQIFYTDQNLVGEVQDLQNSRNEILKKCRYFLREWHNAANQYIYRDQIMANANAGRFYVRVDLSDVDSFDQRLATLLRNKPSEFHPLMEQAAREVYEAFSIDLDTVIKVPDFQVQMFSNENPRPLRDLKSSLLGTLVTIDGIIVSSNKVHTKAKTMTMECSNCHHIKHIYVPFGLGGAIVPRYCDRINEPGPGKEKCPLDSYVVLPEKCEFYDQQVLKIQESPESLPTGEIPRTFQIVVDRYLVDKLMPGTRVTISGIYTVLEKKTLKPQEMAPTSLKLPYVIALGFRGNKSGARKLDPIFSPEEEEKFQVMSKDPRIYEKISKSIASAIYGHDDIKKAICCLLFGGSRKVLPDKMKLRGDINILLIGDPSTAKSQFLKFVERVAPISIYTSGKGSSAAGLTASIIKDASTGEFQLEGGAMVLADGGIVCIDEFDKMRQQDRIAIHEAMEQQTISVAKAGITTILNSRTSVLAAANPIFGRYDDLKQIAEQIELQTTILSRFDCIFVVRDVRTSEQDKMIAGHIIDLHMGKNLMEAEETDIDINFLKKYIAYSRAKISPRLSEKSSTALQNFYVETRQNVQENSIKSRSKHHIPVTVRQLEAIIRLSESLAKLTLSPNVEVEHVDEACRLFKVSTLSAIKNGLDLGLDVPVEMASTVLKVEESIKKRLPIGSKISHTKLQEELMARFNNLRAIEVAIINMIRRDEIQHFEGKRVLLRKK